MSTPSKDCLVCKGLGWYEAPYYGDLNEPRVILHACPGCNPVEPMSGAGFFLVGVLVAFFVVFLMWGAR